jgi:hypothetical protein
MLWEITKQIEGHTICALGDAAAWPVQVRPSSSGVGAPARPQGLGPGAAPGKPDAAVEGTPSTPPTRWTPPPHLTPCHTHPPPQGLIRHMRHEMEDRIKTGQQERIAAA